MLPIWVVVIGEDSTASVRLCRSRSRPSSRCDVYGMDGMYRPVSFVILSIPSDPTDPIAGTGIPSQNGRGASRAG